MPSPGGSTPVSWLSERFSRTSRESPPSSAGMVPVSALLPKLRCDNSSRPPNAAGIVPSRLADATSTRVTRCGVPPPRVMPVQSPIAVLALQSSVAVPRSVSLAASSSAQSPTSPGLSAGLGTTVPFSHGAAGVACGSAGGGDATTGDSVTAADVNCGPASEVRTIAAVSAAMSSTGVAKAA